MAIKSRGIASDGTRLMTLDEFKEWLKKFDEDKDGRISRSELQEAIKFTGSRLAFWKSWLGLRSVDDNGNGNGNGFIDDDEISGLADFAHKQLGIKLIIF